MAKMTLLEMTQKILSAMDSDEVNSIEDTGNVEARQVVDIIEDTYYDLMNNSDWEHLKKTVQLTSLSDSDFPSTLQLPESVVQIEQIRYDTRESGETKLNYTVINYMSPEDFTNRTLSRDNTDANVDNKTVKGAGTPLLIFNDRAPDVWTSFDDEYIVFDAYDSDVESTLQGNKSLAYCIEIPTFDANDDDYVPDCPIHMFPTLLAESKRACFFYLKEAASPIDERRVMQGKNKLKRRDARAHERIHRVNYGRR